MLREVGRAVSRALNGNPFVRAGKNARNAVVDHAFRRRDAAAGRAFAAALAERSPRRVAFAIAFNSPWVVDLLTAAWRAHPPGFALVVLDNSSAADARSRHAEICRRRGVPWLGLPPNPEWNPNRSHGIAMNWAWFNVVRHARLESAGFIDHDCFPTAPCDLPARLTGHAVHGLHLPSISATHPEAWHLWAGYCFVNLAATTGHVLDFKHRIEYGLDTGGGNWPGFYRHLPDGAVGRAAADEVEITLGPDVPAARLARLDGSFIHVGGASYLDQHRDPARRERLVAALWKRYLPDDAPLS